MLSHVIIINLYKPLMIFEPDFAFFFCLHFFAFMYFTHDSSLNMGEWENQFNGLQFSGAFVCAYLHYLWLAFKTNINRFTRFCRSFVKLAKSMRWYTFTIVQDEVRNSLAMLKRILLSPWVRLFFLHRYNTTAPMYGISLTSGQPVTIVQKFPDLLQQVVFEVCEWVNWVLIKIPLKILNCFFVSLTLFFLTHRSTECDLVRGDCVQTYVPYLFLVIPLGPVTLTGQDYILVESGKFI